MKCNYCDYTVSEDCKCCPNCGEDPKTKKKNKIKEQLEKEGKETKNAKGVTTSIDPANLYVLWGVISFFIPFVGLILFCMWIKSKPKEAKAAGIGALARVAIYIFYFGLGLFVRFITNR